MRRPTNEINDRQIGLYNAVLWNENSISGKRSIYFFLLHTIKSIFVLLFYFHMLFLKI